MIIGVIAMMTIPGLVTNATQQEAVARLKRTYSQLENAYRLATEVYGYPTAWRAESTGKNSHEKALNIFANYLNVEKNCGIGKGCFPDLQYGGDKNFEETDWIAKARLTDGTLLGINLSNYNCEQNYGVGDFEHSCGWIYVDTNGTKGPNLIGRDMFLFYITKERIVPAGTPEDTLYPVDKGWGNAAWVIYKGNMDYLSKKVSW